MSPIGVRTRWKYTTPRAGHLTTFFGDSEQLSPRGVEYLRLNVADNEKRRLVTNFEPEYRFTLPTGVEVDGEGRIFVVDNIRFRLQVYRKEMK